MFSGAAMIKQLFSPMVANGDAMMFVISVIERMNVI